MSRTLGALAALLAAALTAAAQHESPTPIIESVGIGTAQGAPTHIDFWLHRTFEAESAAAAMEAAGAFEGKLRKEIAERAIAPGDMEASAPSLSELGQFTARVSARLRFSAGPYVKSETGPKDFGTLCDNVLAAAKTLGCADVEILCETSEKSALIQAAIALATENAYPAADASARALGTSIFAVDSVSVSEIVWNDPPESRAVIPNLRQITVTARVKVVYTVDPA